VHVNTAQRLERVTALLGDGWQKLGRALDLQLALRLRRRRDRWKPHLEGAKSGL
jgi:hypothetical protein